MKIINFTAVEILPKLLSKEKNQTIRPIPKNRKPRFKVGEKVKLMWKQRSKHKWFCRNTGIGVIPSIIMDKELKDEDTSTAVFNKTIGTAKITEVFKIKLRMDELPEGKNRCLILPSDYDFGQITESPEILGDIAQRDGFKNSKEMFEYFDKKYDLSTLKEFWVYRWEWD